jgi:hypothetical protein
VRTLFWLKFAGTAGGIAIFFYAYFWAMRHPLAEVAVMPLIWLDGQIAFRPLSFLLYVFLWFYISFGTALARDFRELAAFGLASLAISLAGLAIFMVLPTRVPDPGIDWRPLPWAVSLSISPRRTTLQLQPTTTTSQKLCWVNRSPRARLPTTSTSR